MKKLIEQSNEMEIIANNEVHRRKNTKKGIESKDYWETRLPQKWYSETVRYFRYFPYLYEYAEFMEHKGDKVLEIGIGVGRDLLQYAKNGAICYGIDLTEDSIKRTRKLFKEYNLKAELISCNAEDMPFKDKQFDLVYSIGVIHHFKNMDKGMDEIRRVLKDNGKAIIWLYGKDWWYYFFAPLFHGILGGDFLRMNYKDMIHKNMEMDGNVPIVNFFNKKEVIEFYDRNGFEIIELEHFGGRHTLGNKMLPLNRMFCTIMRTIFPYACWFAKVKKK